MALSRLINKTKKLPDLPGVYFFLGKNREVLYIGKAASLRSRVRSYFSGDLEETRGPWVAKMIPEAITIDFKKTDTVLEALILEADLIRKFKPPYNTREKDDKSYNCIVITDEDFPQVLIVRKKDLENIDGNEFKIRKVFGPFPHGVELREAMKIIRRIFPYRDQKCFPLQERPCFNRQISLCPGVCTGEISQTEYKKIVRNIELLFEGRKLKILGYFKKEMDRYAKLQEFEKANAVKKKIFALKHIQDIALIKEDFRGRGVGRLFRIEAFDVAHLGGKSARGVMIVLEDGYPSKEGYRIFKIRSANPGDDIGSLKEVLERRFAHTEWDFPDLVVIDGGETHRNIAAKAIGIYDPRIPIVSVVKDEMHKAREILGDTSVAETHKKQIIFANAEAHRFAIGRHRRSLRTSFLPH